MKLPDGTIIPSFLGVESRGKSTAGDNPTLQDNVLRIGEVKQIIYPDNPLSYSKQFVEYEVAVQYKEGTGSYVTSTYRGVGVNNAFGGIADQFWSTYRADSNAGSHPSSGVGVGSKVLIMCVSGSQKFAIILGGVKDLNAAPDKASDGHHLYFEFNGLQAEIKDDGELEVIFHGKTQVDGSLDPSAVASAEGSRLQVNKQGNILLASPDDAQFVRINHESKKIQILADTEWSVEVNGTTNITSQDAITITTNAGATHNAVDNIKMLSAGVLVGDATDAWVKGTTYRMQESLMNQQIASALSSLSQTQSQMITALGKAAVKLAAGNTTDAGAALAELAASWASFGATYTMMATAIQTFEGQAPSYLSIKNKCD